MRKHQSEKVITSNNAVLFSEPVMVIIGQKGGSLWLMYPVPVRDQLNLQYNGTELIKGVITVIVQNVANGQLLVRLRLASTTRLINVPVSNLGRGIYDLRIYISDQVVWNQRFVK